MKKNLLYIILLGAMIFSSCSDWLLETNPNVSDADSYWQNLEQTDRTLTATYTTLLSSNILLTREEAWRADMAVPGYGRPTYTGVGLSFYSQAYNSSDDYIRSKWEMLYSGIFKANQCLEGLDKVLADDPSIDMEEWTEQRAQARFLRGLFYFYLYTSYNKGSVIIKETVPTIKEEYHTSLSPADSVRAFYLDDLRYAYENLPVTYDGAAGNNGRAAKGAAATILGTSFLYDATLDKIDNPDVEMLDSAIYYLGDVVYKTNASYPYELVTDYNLMFTNSGEMNLESILEVEYNHDNRPDMDTWREDRSTNRLAIYSVQPTGTSFFPSSWITWEYMNESIDSLDQRNFYYVDVYDTEKTDSLVRIDTVAYKASRRAASMLALSYDDETEYYQTYAHEVSQFNFKNGVSRYKKYTNHEVYENENDNPGGNLRSAKNVTINRLADVYLMLAEAYIHKTRVDYNVVDLVEAYRLINEVRGRWALERIGPSSIGDPGHQYDEIMYSPEDLFARLKDIEKPLEMSVEGHCIRWFDLRRWGTLKSNFEKLSQEIYYPDYYSVARFDTSQVDRSVISISDVEVNSSWEGGQTYIDYEQAAANFNYDIHAWFAIPPTEIIDNTALD